MNCSQCGKPAPVDARFCDDCGNPLSFGTPTPTMSGHATIAPESSGLTPRPAPGTGHPPGTGPWTPPGTGRHPSGTGPWTPPGTGRHPSGTGPWTPPGTGSQLPASQAHTPPGTGVTPPGTGPGPTTVRSGLFAGLSGRVLAGKYELRQQVGRGGMGTVFAGWHRGLGIDVAVKFLLPELAAQPQASERFLREARACVKIRHPHAVGVYDLDRDPVTGALYMVMDYCEGRPLLSVLAADGPLPVPVAIELSLQILGALEAAHLLGLVHRDIKPSNIMVRESEGRLQVKVLDFGIARACSQAARSEMGGPLTTRAGAMIGTPGYMSPEQSAGMEVDHRSDLFSTAIVLYEMLTGRRPWEADNPVRLAGALLGEPHTPIREYRALPQGLVRAIDRALAKDADARFPDARAMREALAPFASDAPPVSGGSRGGGAGLAVVALLVLVLAAGAAWWAGALDELLPPAWRARAEESAPTPDGPPGDSSSAGTPTELPPDGPPDEPPVGPEDPPDEPPVGPEDPPDVPPVGPEDPPDDPPDPPVDPPVAPPPAPRFTALAPASGSWVRENAVGITGAVRGVRGVTIQGMAVPVGADGSFTLSLHVAEGEQQIELAAENAGGRADTNLVVLVDRTLPTVELENLSAGLVTDQTRLAIRGRVRDAHPRRVVVGTVRADTGPDGSFALELPIEPERRSELLFEAFDKAGNRGTLRVEVSHDGRAPRVEFSSAGTSESAIYRIEGELLEPHLASAHLAGQPVAAGPFSVPVRLEPGPNSFTLTAEDLAGNSAEESFTVTYVPPAVEPPPTVEPAMELPAAWRVVETWEDAPRDQRERSLALGVPVSVENGLGMRLVLVPDGTSTLGSDPGEQGRKPRRETRHQVTLTRSFYIKEAEVTQEEYERVMGDNPAFFRDPQAPVERVSWLDAVRFCNALSALEGLAAVYTVDAEGGVTWDRDAVGYRLPTEAEWEHACRAGASTAYPWGERHNGALMYSERNAEHPMPVGTMDFRRCSYGTYDMNGNVWEWCWDYYDEGYGRAATAATDPTGPAEGDVRVFRGGSFFETVEFCRAAERQYARETSRLNDVGFRPVLTVR